MDTPKKESKYQFKVGGENGFSTNFFMSHPKMGRSQFTFRSATADEWPAVLAEINAFTTYMHEQGWTLDGEATQPLGQPSATPPQSDKKSYEPKPVPDNEVPEELPSPAEGGMPYFKDEFDWFEITPQPDDKATVKFYKDGLQYPVGAAINKWKNANVAKALEAFGNIDVSKAQKIREAGVQYWTKGNEYIIAQGAHKGEKSHYKDFRLAQKTF